MLAPAHRPEPTSQADALPVAELSERVRGEHRPAARPEAREHVDHAGREARVVDQAREEALARARIAAQEHRDVERRDDFTVFDPHRSKAREAGDAAELAGEVALIGKATF